MRGKVTETSTERFYERFPHLRRIDAIWGSSECRSFLLHLLLDTREGMRQGFPKEHGKTIISLLMEHDRCFPEFENESAHHDYCWDDQPPRRGSGAILR